MAWPLVPLVVGLAYCVFTLLLLRVVTGEWPDWIVPGSHGGAWETDWYQDESHPQLRERLRAAIRARVERDAPSEESATEIGWRVKREQRTVRLGPSLPHPFDAS